VGCELAQLLIPSASPSSACILPQRLIPLPFLFALSLLSVFIPCLSPRTSYVLAAPNSARFTPQPMRFPFLLLVAIHADFLFFARRPHFCHFAIASLGCPVLLDSSDAQCFCFPPLPTHDAFNITLLHVLLFPPSQFYEGDASSTPRPSCNLPPVFSDRRHSALLFPSTPLPHALRANLNIISRLF